ncbi:MAG: hypothetical protein L6R37_008313 [Teloschistes peruensis]|nr:MAG: hypothetical protein L6R37_008313 [Teloschistes peruensis]
MTTEHLKSLDRTACRLECRRKLSEHLLAKLGLSIEPANVRLVTSASDLYTWQAIPEKAHLFKKHLSKQTISAYREICRDVGVTFEAIHSSDLGDRSVSGFSATIEKLKNEKDTLYTEVEDLKEQLAKAMQIKVAAEEEAQRLQLMLSSSMVEKQIMQQNLQTLADMVDYLRSAAVIAAKEFLHKIELQVRLESPGA